MKKFMAGAMALVLMLTMLSGCNLLKKEPTLRDVLIGEWTLTADLNVITGFLPEGQRTAFSLFASVSSLLIEPISMDATFNEDGTLHLELSQAGNWLTNLLGLLDSFLGTDIHDALGENGGLLTSILNVVESGIGDFHYQVEGDRVYIWGIWQSEQEALGFTCQHKNGTITITEIVSGNTIVKVSGGSLKLTRKEIEKAENTN